MKKKIRDLKGSKDWLREGGNRVRLTGAIWYTYPGKRTSISVEHDMGIKNFETDDGSDAAELEVEIELA